ncbi:MAG: anhydro-N-acetylmuramic acid kinase [Halioglobus sp.]|nr:anhydro-N-acetylmuramic acid kinase [Halioglobus sp.]
MAEPELYIGLMSGTSIDGIDAALVGLDGHGYELRATHAHPLSEALRAAVAAISCAGDNEIERLGPLDRALGAEFGRAALQLLEGAGVAPAAVRAIGSHGQTIRHRPPSQGHDTAAAFTLQIADPNTIAEVTGITTVADFRRRDMAAGGEGAPLAPAFHQAAFATAGVRRAVVNIGGIANISLLDGAALVAGFDCGPGNTLLDHWAQQHLGERYDAGGAWAQGGAVATGLLDELLDHPFFAQAGPRSTGKESFNLEWALAMLAGHPSLSAQDVQATFLELTARGIMLGLAESAMVCEEIYVCGGGAHNAFMLQRLQQLLAPATVATTEALGLAPDWVEAATFAWLAQRTLQGCAGNAPVVTGATGERVLGAIYPAR